MVEQRRWEAEQQAQEQLQAEGEPSHAAAEEAPVEDAIAAEQPMGPDHAEDKGGTQGEAAPSRGREGAQDR